MASDGAMNLAALGLMSAGAVLAYSAVNDPVGGPIGVVRDLLSGRTPTPGVQTVTKPVGPVAGQGTLAPAPGLEDVPSSARDKVVAIAKTYMGVPYLWAGASRRGIDCSGLVLVAYRDGAGIKLPHRATLQAARGKRIPRDQCRAGDLVAWGVPGNYPHIALAINGVQCIGAWSSGTKVMVKNIDIKAVPGYGLPDIIQLLP